MDWFEEIFEHVSDTFNGIMDHLTDDGLDNPSALDHLDSDDGMTTVYPANGLFCSMDNHGGTHLGSVGGHDAHVPFGEANGDRVFIAEDGKYHRGLIGGSGPDMGLGGLA